MALCFPKDALYGTQEFNGFKFEDPYEMQGIAKLTLYLQETANQTDTGKWLIATAEGLRFEAGFNISTNNLHWEAVDYYTTDCWYKSLLEFIYTSNKEGSKLQLKEDITDIPTLREYDKYLMEEFIRAKIPLWELKIINELKQSL